jgi:uncharacterized protein DUF1697
VKTILSSGNVAFDSASRSVAAIERRIEAALSKQVGRSFYTILGSVEELNDLIKTDPYAAFDLSDCVDLERSGFILVSGANLLWRAAHCTGSLALKCALMGRSKGLTARYRDYLRRFVILETNVR